MANESLLELWDLLASRDFIALGASLLFIVFVGSGAWGRLARWAARVLHRSPEARRDLGAGAGSLGWVRGLVWVVFLAGVGVTFYLGVVPHGDRGSEWGEVLFNGQLL